MSINWDKIIYQMAHKSENRVFDTSKTLVFKPTPTDSNEKFSVGQRVKVYVGTASTGSVCTGTVSSVLNGGILKIILDDGSEKSYMNSYVEII